MHESGTRIENLLHNHISSIRAAVNPGPLHDKFMYNTPHTTTTRRGVFASS